MNSFAHLVTLEGTFGFWGSLGDTDAPSCLHLAANMHGIIYNACCNKHDFLISALLSTLFLCLLAWQGS